MTNSLHIVWSYLKKCGAFTSCTHVHIIHTSDVRSNSSKNCFHGRTLCGVVYDKKNYLTLEASTEITLAFKICTLKTLDDSSFQFFSFIKNRIKEKKKIANCERTVFLLHICICKRNALLAIGVQISHLFNGTQPKTGATLLSFLNVCLSTQ